MRCPHCNKNIVIDEEALRLQVIDLAFGYQDAVGFKRFLEKVIKEGKWLQN